MMLAILMAIQIAAAPAVTPEARAKYEPYRRCLLGQAGKIDTGDKSDDNVIEIARRNCMAANLHGGTQALFAEMNAGLSKDAAIELVAMLRSAIETEALIAIRATPAAKR